MAVAKKTTKAATKTTATKKTATATKKTTTVAKKTTSAAKTTVKKTATTTKSTELSVSGNKKIATLCADFNKKFPYLTLRIFYSYARNGVAKGERISPIPGDKTLASVRRADSGGDISISGNKKVKSLEAEFDKVFGLYAQICYTVGDDFYYTTGSYDDMTLSALNSRGEALGWRKGRK